MKKKFTVVEKLPVINQTKTMQKFYDATIDQVFGKGEAVRLENYIGRKPIHFNPETDYYKPESTTPRKKYQLEPVMVSSNDDREIDETLFYYDFAEHLSANGALVNDPNRLFRSESYTWCPPINMDKITRYGDYYWLTNGAPVLLLSVNFMDINGDGKNDNIHYKSYVATGYAKRYPAPKAIDGLDMDYVVHINGSPLSNSGTIDGNDDNHIIVDGNLRDGMIDGGDDQGYYVSDNIVVFSDAPKSGDVIEIWANANILKHINGKSEFRWESYAYAYIHQSINTANGIEIVKYGPELIEIAPPLKYNMRVDIDDNNGYRQYVVNYKDGLIELVEFEYDENLQNPEPEYVTIEKNAFNNNRWSIGNKWFHKDDLFFHSSDFIPIKATRPIIEFNRDLELVGHGTSFVPNVNVVWDSANGTPRRYVANANGTIAQIPSGITGLRKPEYGESYEQDIRILVLNSSDANERQKILKGRVRVNSMRWDNDDMVKLSAQTANPVKGNWDDHPDKLWEFGVELLSLEDGRFGYVGKAGDTVRQWERYDTWAYQNKKWTPQDNKRKEGRDNFPLFRVHTVDGKLLTNIDGDEVGTTIFEYATGIRKDPVLKFDVKHNKHGNFIYNTTLVTDKQYENRIEYNGLRMYSRYTNKRKYESIWHVFDGVPQEKDEDGLYDIPLSLQANPLNTDVDYISLNEWHTHMLEVIESNDWNATSDNFDYNLGRHIMQHRSPLLKTMLFNSNDLLNVINAIDFSNKEYIRFKGKFKQVAERMLTGGVSDPDSIVSQAINTMNLVKTTDFPFHDNGMMGDNNFIPATASYLGITPNYKPELFIENDKVLIRGHDGTLTFGSDGENVSEIDRVMLAFETRIWNSIPEAFRNNRIQGFDLRSFVSSAFRTNDYSREEFLQVSRNGFEAWCSEMGYNYRVNDIYEANDPFTWNFNGSNDVFGNPVIGYWRGQYMYYYDTDRPHTHPWEMMGYTSKPSFWDTHYSWTNASKRNKLINDITNGIVNPVTKEYDYRFERSQFKKIIPVDIKGKLLNPIETGIISSSNEVIFELPWVYGDGSPIETAWRNSTSYQFDMSVVSYLLKPSRFVESCWLSGDEKFSNDQWYNGVTRNRKHDDKQVVYTKKSLGIQTWMGDLIKNNGLDVDASLGVKVRNLGVNLAHKLGAYVDAESIKLLAENIGMLPSENAKVRLYRSPSFRTDFYSGMIIEWTGRGWRVIGYDMIHPFFNFYDVIEAGNKMKITIGDDIPEAYDWNGNQRYDAGVYVLYKTTTYKCVKTHTSSNTFEQRFWVAEALGVKPKSATWFLEHYTDVVNSIPYGHEFTTIQDVITFLSGYQAYLKSRGWVFDDVDSDNVDYRDFKRSAKELLYWSQTMWDVGTFLAISPSAYKAKYFTEYGTVNKIDHSTSGLHSIVDKTGYNISSNDIFTDRSSENVVVESEKGIYGLRLTLSEIEHILLFDNKTIFNDVIYEPLYNIRQYRLRLSALVSGDWRGRLQADGFVVEMETMRPSFDRQTEDIRYAFDVERPISLPLSQHAKHQIGFQNRKYLDNIIVNDINQFEFYQGMIQHKGTLGVLNRLKRSDRLSASRDLIFLEEWAFMKDRYGGVDTIETIEFMLDKNKSRSESVTVLHSKASLWDIMIWDIGKWDKVDTDIDIDLSFIDGLDGDFVRLMGGGNTDKRWIVPPKDTIYENDNTYVRPDFYMTDAGYVRVDETEYQGLTIRDVSEYLETNDLELYEKENVWVYDIDGKWDVLNPLPVNQLLTLITNDYDSDGALLEFDAPVNINKGDFIYIGKEVKEKSNELFGIWEVSHVDDTKTSFTIAMKDGITQDVKFDDTEEYTEERPVLLRLISKRFIKNDLDISTIDSLNSVIDLPKSVENKLSIPKELLVDDTIIYIDTCYETNHANKLRPNVKRWNVFKYINGAFTKIRTQPKRVMRERAIGASLFDVKTKIDDKSIEARPLIKDDIFAWSPISNQFHPSIRTNIDFIISTDPAQYDTDDANTNYWGEDRIGALWWDTSLSRFLDADTNDDEFDYSEMRYRIDYFGKLAPNTRVVVKEWTKSFDEPKGVENVVIEYVRNYEKDKNKEVPVYYYWSENPVTIPSGVKREVSAYSLSQLVTNPEISGVSYISPLSVNAFTIGGVIEYLNGTTYIQIKTRKTDIKANTHTDWELLRKGDEDSQPTRKLWNRFVLSLASINPWNKKLPFDSIPSYDQVGFDVERGQSLFSNVREARRTMVDIVNSIASRNLTLYTLGDMNKLSNQDGKSNHLHWTQRENSYYVKPVPSELYWDYKTNDPNTITNNGLVYLLREADNFWSVMRKKGNKFEVVKQYDRVVNTLSELSKLTVTNNTIVRVNGNDETGGFYTIWKRISGKFVLVSHQMFNSADCWEYCQWKKSNDYSEPSNVFATISERDVFFSQNPELKYCKVKSNNDGLEAWYERNGDVWDLVALEDGTFKFKNNLFKNTGNKIEGFIDTELSKFDAYAFKESVQNRDMGHEISWLLNALREGIFTKLNINNVFFNLVESTHANNDYVDWCFKTSFLYVYGYKEVVNTDPMMQNDIIDDVVDYINEVKPYHAKIRDFKNRYGLKTDSIVVSGFDFDKPVYYDIRLGVNRVLDIDNPDDLKIIKNGMWSYWYNDFEKDYSKVRKLNIKKKELINMDIKPKQYMNIRVTRREWTESSPAYGWDIFYWDGDNAWDWNHKTTNADYIEKFFNIGLWGSVAWEMFDWDEDTLPNPRKLYVRMINGVDSGDYVMLNVNKGKDLTKNPIFELEYKGEKYAGTWTQVNPYKGRITSTPI